MGLDKRWAGTSNRRYKRFGSEVEKRHRQELPDYPRLLGADAENQRGEAQKEAD
jgi:hypothetical protein